MAGGGQSIPFWTQHGAQVELVWQKGLTGSKSVTLTRLHRAETTALLTAARIAAAFPIIDLVSFVNGKSNRSWD